MVTDGGHRDRAVPARPTIGGGKGQQRAFAGILDGNNHRAIGLNQRLAADHRGIIGRRLPGAPGQSPIGGSTHLDEIAIAVVVPLGITMAVEGAGRGIIADRPVFILAGRSPSGIHLDETGAPGQSAICRAADQNRRSAWGIVGV